MISSNTSVTRSSPLFNFLLHRLIYFILSQILAEEKGRVDAMAEGLEEESKKALQMEAELEKQLAQFFVETQQLKLNLSKQEKR